VISSPKGKGIIPFVVEITLDRKPQQQQQQVKIEENQGKEGEFSVSFAPTIASQHQISVSHKGKHFKGSPFRIDVVDRPVITTLLKPTLFFNLVPADQEMVSLVTRVMLPAIQVVTPLFQTAATTECKYLTRQAGSCSNSGLREMEMGSFPRLGVSLLTRETTKLWLLTVPIIAFKSLMREVALFVPLGHRSGDGQLSGPYDVVVDSQGNYFVAEINNNRVSVFDSNGQFLRKFGSHVNVNGQLDLPIVIGLLSNGNVVVVEHENSQVSIFDSQGNFVRHVGAGQLAYPFYLFVDSDDNILVADYGDGRIQVFKADGSLVKTMGSGQLSGPTGVSMDSEGGIIVCENSAARISIF